MNVASQVEVHDWKPAAWLRVTGEDAASFLQGQFTNDLRGHAPGSSVYGLWLNVKGKVVADSFVLQGTAPNEFWIASTFSPAAVIRERLESHVIADDVVIEDLTDGWAALTVFGTESAGLVRAQQAAVGSSFAFPARRGRTDATEWVFPNSAASAAETAFAGAPRLDRTEMERRRIDAGIPAIPADIGPNDLPNEAGLDSVAISYTKGCYLGQEVMARLKSMGQVRRRLLRVSGETATLPALPAPVFVGPRQVGELRSAVAVADRRVLGLALVSLLHVNAGCGLAFTADAAPILRLVDAP